MFILLKRITFADRISLRSEVSSNNAVKTETAIVLPKPARRVLPEHEGQYKIVLPTGTTQRSREILEKRALRKNNTDIELRAQ